MEKKNWVLYFVLLVTIFISNYAYAQTHESEEHEINTHFAPKVSYLSTIRKEYIEERQRQGLKINPEINKKYIALTFDDGPCKSLTPELLEILRKNEVKATFFVLGSRVKSYPGILQDIYDDGHEIGNHSWSHPFLARASSAKVANQINSTQNIIFKTVGVRPVVFRPPYGSTSSSVANTATNCGVRQIIWDVDPRDWRDPATSRTVSYILNHSSDGDIVLMHDIHANTIRAVPGIIAGFKKRGYTFVTVSEILKLRQNKPSTKMVKKKSTKHKKVRVSKVSKKKKVATLARHYGKKNHH